jgi:hypothetical protein
MDKSGHMTRRDFVRSTACAGLGAAMGVVAEAAAGRPDHRSKVVLVRDENVLDHQHEPQPQVLRSVLDRAVCLLSGEADPVAAWRRYFQPDDLVGLKTNEMMLKTPPALAAAMRQRLGDVGVPAGSIHETDRDAYRLLGKCTALLNTCGFKSHWLSGIGGAVKNYLTFVPPDERPHYHDNYCANVGTVWSEPVCRGKTRLVVIDLLRPLFNGGPQVNPHYQWDYKGLLVSTDPVAADTVCLRLLQNKRNDFKGERWDISPLPVHIETACREHGLGTCDWGRIDLVKAGWAAEALV